MTPPFDITWDYRCPFARNANEHVITALEHGAEWKVSFRAFSLDQVHLGEGQPDVWDDPGRYPGALVNLAGIVVRDMEPDMFLRVHRALFAARHDQASDTRDRSVIAGALNNAGVDAGAILSEVDAGWPMKTLRGEHMDAVQHHDAFGVPTFIAGKSAVFVRLLDRPDGDAILARSTIERVLDLITEWPSLNELKYTKISR